MTKKVQDMTIRMAVESDLDTLMGIFDTAKQYMAAHGNPNQWIQGYPSEELIRQQIAQKWCHVCLLGEEVVATFCFIPGPDPTYARIDGAWLSDRPYYVVHRIASSGRVKGVTECCLKWCRERCRSLRIDTHRDNLPMQHLLNKNGFHYCGIIRVANGTERLAYQADF